MAYIGRDIEQGTFTKQTFTADSSTTVFTLSHAVVSANNLLVSVGGVIQEPDSAYTASGTVLTFTGTPTTGDLIWVVYLGKSLTSTTVREAITKQVGVGDGTTTPITLSSSVVNSASIIVSLNGVVQVPDTDFVASGTTLTFTTAPSAALAILVYFLQKKARLGKPADGSVTAAKLASSGTLPAVDGSALTGILSHTDLHSLRTNIALAGFNRSTDHATTVLGMPNGFIDQFEDQTGVDDTNSIEGLYDASGDYYSPDGREFTNLTSIMTSANTPSGTVSASSGTTPFYMFDHTLAGGGFYSDNPFNSPTYVQYAFNNGLSAQIITTYTITSDTDAPAARAPKNWTLKASNTGSFGGEEVTLNTQSNQSFGNHETKTYAFSNSTAYVYYRLIVTDIGNNTDLLRMFELELKGLGPVGNMTLITETSTASASPDNAHIALFNEEVDALTLDTDIMAWASRSKQTFTATNATNVLTASSHGLGNTNRVMLTTTDADLPAGLDSETVYYVVNKTVNTFKVSLTSGGVAVTFSDDGTGTHSVRAVTKAALVDRGDFETGKATLSALVDISGQPTGTDMSLIVQTKNNKATKLHGMSMQYT